MDNAPEQIYGQMKDVINAHHIKVEPTLPKAPWRNKAEASIRELKTLMRRTMRSSCAPVRTWCYALEWAAAIRRYTASDMLALQGQTSDEYVGGTIPDISVHSMFTYFQVVRFRSPTTGKDPKDAFFTDAYGYYLGVAEATVDEMAVNILTKGGKVVARKSVWALTRIEMEEQSTTLSELWESVKSKIGDKIPDQDFQQHAEDFMQDLPGGIFSDLDE